jgi:hypothetical protein
MPSGADANVVFLEGVAMVDLIRALAEINASAPPPYAVIGGVAVSARLGRAHRVTADVDAILQDGFPSPLEVILAAGTARRPPGWAEHRLQIHGTKIEFITVEPLDPSDDLSELAENDALFVAAHAWALATAEDLLVVSADEPAVRTAVSVGDSLGAARHEAPCH